MFVYSLFMVSSLDPFASVRSSPQLVVRMRVAAALERAMESATAPGSPPKLAQAIRYAVFPGGSRLRPQLCLAVAMACGDPHPDLSDAAAVAIELVHCASLVHDDLPCFDDADLRRGKPSVHRAFSESTALLVGDALIVHAFEVLAVACATMPALLPDLAKGLSQAAGSRRGIIAGQAWESEPAVALDEYHRAKTASLFEAATTMGAMAAGAKPAPWRTFGDVVGRLYQAADDLADVTGAAAEMGKPQGQDAAHGRPNVVSLLGKEAARRRLQTLFEEALGSIPACPADQALRAWVERMAAKTGLV